MINDLLYPYIKVDCPLHLGLPKCTLTNVEGNVMAYVERLFSFITHPIRLIVHCCCCFACLCVCFAFALSLVGGN